MKKKEPVIVIIFATAFLFLLITSFYYGIIKYWQSYRIATLICFMIIFSCPILIGLLYFWGIKLKTAQWTSVIFSLIYGSMIYIVYNTRYNNDLDKHGLTTHGVIYNYSADAEGQGYTAKVTFKFNNITFESSFEFNSKDDFKIGDSIEVEFSRIHPNINRSRKMTE